MNYFRKISSALLILIAFPNMIFGQSGNVNIDSLKRELKKYTLKDTTHIQLKYLIGDESRIYRGGYWDTIINDCEQLINTQKNHKIQLACEKILSSSLLNRGLLFKFEGDFPKALDYYYKSLKIAIKIGDKSSQAYCYNNIGRVHIDLGDQTLALKYYKLSLALRLELNDQSGIAESYNNMGVIYDKNGEKEKAIDYYKKCLQIHEETGNKEGEAYIYNNLGTIYQKINPKLALDYLLKSLAIRKELGDLQGMAHIYSSLGGYYTANGDFNKALPYHKEGLKISQAIGYPYLIEIHAKELSAIYERQGKSKDALNMYKLYIQMRDSLNNESVQRASIEQQTKFEYEKQKVLDDATTDKKIAIEHEAKKKQTIITYATTSVLALVAIFLFIVFNRLKVTRRQKNTIEKQKGEVEKAHKELGEKSKEITASIQYAKRIQSAILPHNKEIKERLTDSFVLYLPKDIVAGDFYWMEQLNNQTLFAVADCTGHGVPGAMVSVVCNNGLNRSVREYGLTDPGQILDKTRELVVQEFEKSEDDVKDGMDIAFCSLSVDSPSNGVYRELKYAGAHNPLWIIKRYSTELGPETKDTYELLEIKADKQPIGKFDNPKPYKTHTVALQKGDSIYIFSDGYADQFGGEDGKKFKTAHFKKLLLAIQSESMEKQKELIEKAFAEWMGNLEQVDDVCVIGIRV